MNRKLLVLGAVILLSSVLLYPGFYYPPSPKQEAPVLGDRVKEALQRRQRELRCIVWVEHHSTVWERKVNLVRSLLGIENIGGRVINLYPRLSAACVSVPAENVGSLLRFPGVRFVDLDAPVSTLAKVTLSLEDVKRYVDAEALPGDGRGVDVYVLDTGAPVDITVDSSVSFAGPSPYDGNGHGSAVIGIIKAIAPRARIHSVKVLRDDGSGSISSVLEGVEYALKQPGEKKLINASLGVQESTLCSLKEAFSVLVESGAEAVVAAGNDPQTPMSPGTCPRVITVGAVSGDNLLTEYSFRRFDVVSYGDQVGVSGPFKDREIRGTSFATPVVTGLAARYLSSIKGTTSQVNLERTILKGSVRTPEGYLLPVASALAETPPEVERAPLPPALFLPTLLAGLSLVFAGLFSR